MFEEFPKIARLFRDCTVTEKIDGTNAQIYIELRAAVPEIELDRPTYPWMSVSVDGLDYVIAAGSRKRWVGLSGDNFGFGHWVSDNRYELVDLGVGRHYGEWWGQGIQRKYGLDHKRFSLFNTSRWGDDTGKRPDCCHVVPVLYEGAFDPSQVLRVADELENEGSAAAPGFMKPEGVVIFHQHANACFKYTPANGDGHKG